MAFSQTYWTRDNDSRSGDKSVTYETMPEGDCMLKVTKVKVTKGTPIS